MNRQQWENRYEDALDIAFQDTTEEQYADKQAFLDAMWDEFNANQNEDAALVYENQKWGVQ